MHSQSLLSECKLKKSTKDDKSIYDHQSIIRMKLNYVKESTYLYP